jgi:hypothetical protein
MSIHVTLTEREALILIKSLKSYSRVLSDVYHPDRSLIADLNTMQEVLSLAIYNPFEEGDGRERPSP